MRILGLVSGFPRFSSGRDHVTRGACFSVVVVVPYGAATRWELAYRSNRQGD